MGNNKNKWANLYQALLRSRRLPWLPPIFITDVGSDFGGAPHHWYIFHVNPFHHQTYLLCYTYINSETISVLTIVHQWHSFPFGSIAPFLGNKKKINNNKKKLSSLLILTNEMKSEMKIFSFTSISWKALKRKCADIWKRNFE